jgi:hypothetical protein
VALFREWTIAGDMGIFDGLLHVFEFPANDHGAIEIDF